MLEEIIYKIKNSSDCIVHPPNGLPNTANIHSLHSDIIQIYELTGGIDFYTNMDYQMRILPPHDFELSNTKILGQECKQYIQDNDISNHWYTIADAGPEQYISVDLHPDRFGRCYDSFCQTHAVPGDSPVLALNPIDLILSIFENKGEYWFWLKDSFSKLGDAYDI